MDIDRVDQATRATLPKVRPRLLATLPAVFFLLLIAAGAVAALVTPQTYRWPRNADLLTGEFTTRYERSFDEHLPLRPLGVTTWGVLEYALYQSGRGGVLVGSNGWLYSSEEFAYYPDEAAQTEAKLDLISRVQERLAADGIALLVALVPSKARLYPEHLGRYRVPSYTLGRYHGFREALGARGIVAPDLLGALETAKTDGDVFLRTDTHWTPHGARVAAQALFDGASTSLDLSRLSDTRFETRSGETVLRDGDLMTFIPLGVFREALGPRPDRIVRQQTERVEAGAVGLFDDLDIPLALVGTSYSADSLWNFAGALEEAFGAEVLNAAQEGQGPFVPMLGYLRGEEIADVPPRLVVWEIPERFIPVAYALDTRGALP